MVTLTPDDGITIANLVFYVPALILGLWLTIRHGWGWNSGWGYICVLGILRITSSTLMLLANFDGQTQDLQTGIILLSIGISPVTLSMVAMIKRVNRGMFNNQGYKMVWFYLLYLVGYAAVGLAAYGVSNEMSGVTADDRSSGKTMATVGMSMFIIQFLITVLIAIRTFFKRQYIASGERKVLYVTMASFPLILVRLTYALIQSEDPTNQTFARVGGNIWVEVFMATLEDYIVVIMYIAVGIVAPIMKKGRKNQNEIKRLSPPGTPEYYQSMGRPQQYQQPLASYPALPPRMQNQGWPAQLPPRPNEQTQYARQYGRR